MVRFHLGPQSGCAGHLRRCSRVVFPWISSGLLAHLGRTICGDLLIGLGEFEECLHHQQVVLDCLRTKIGLDQGFFPGDQISISDRSGIIVPKMLAQLGYNFIESIFGLVLSLTLSRPFGNEG